MPFKGQQFLPGICVPDFEREKEEEEEDEEEEQVSSTHLSATARQHIHTQIHAHNTTNTHTHTHTFAGSVVAACDELVAALVEGTVCEGEDVGTEDLQDKHIKEVGDTEINI